MKKSYAVLLAALMAGVSACYGPFHLTRGLWKWNKTVNSKWGQEGVFLALTIFPVYEFAAIGDALIFNSVEFWTGKNPIKEARATRSLQNGEEQAVMNYDYSTRRLRIDSFEKGRPWSTVILEPSPDGMVARDGKGRLLGSARTVDGQVVVADASGKILRRSEGLR